MGPRKYGEIEDKILNFEVRPEDIWIITYPKCGTTWTQEIVWNIMNDMNEELRETFLFSRSPFLESSSIPHKKKPTGDRDPKSGRKGGMLDGDSVDRAAKLQTPRVIKTHLPLEFLPSHLLDTAKVIYVSRNPKDTCVSYFHMHTSVHDENGYAGDFEQFAEFFMGGALQYGNYFDHLKSGWKHRNHPNMKFLWYEDMLKNPIKEVSEIAEFVNRPMSKDKVKELVEYLKFGNMKERAQQGKGMKATFFRKGEAGDWKNYFKGDNLKLWDEWIAKNLDGSDIKFNFE